MSIIKSNNIIVALVTLIVLFTGCFNEKEKIVEEQFIEKQTTNMNTYIFGIHPLLNSKKLFEVYQPLVDEINKNMKNSKIILESSRNYASFNKKMIAGHFDFALPNPYQTITSLNYGYKVFGKMGDDSSFRGIILLRKDSKIKKVSDLKGKVVAYPAPTALAATMMPQYYLQTHGLDINKDITNKYVGTHASSIMNVYLKKSTASATWPLAWKSYIKENPQIANEVEIRWQTKELINNGLIVKLKTPQDIVDIFSNVIFNLQNTKKGKKILEPMEISKYEKATNKTFEIVTVFLDKFKNTVRPLDIK